MSNSLKAEVFAVGKWNGFEFSKEDLISIASAFHTLGNNHQVPLKMGHNDEQPFTDGQPALGWVVDLSVEGDKLVAEFSDIPDVVYGAFEKKLYRNVSIELDIGVEYKGSYFPFVLSGVALLGADIPAVNTLADLQAYMGRELSCKQKAAFTAVFNKKPEVKNMGDVTLEEQVRTLSAKVDAQSKEIDKLISTNTKLETEKIELKAKFSNMEETDKHRRQLEERALLEKRLDQMVQDKKIAPFTRDEYLADYDQADDKSIVTYSVEKLEKTIDANPAYFGAEQARRKAAQEHEEEEMDVSAIVVQRAKKYQVEHGEKNFAVAKRMILEADRDLANRYTKGGQA